MAHQGGENNKPKNDNNKRHPPTYNMYINNIRFFSAKHR